MYMLVVTSMQEDLGLRWIIFFFFFSYINYLNSLDNFLFRGSAEATKQAHSLIAALIKDPDVDILQILPKSAKSAAAVWEKSVVSVLLIFPVPVVPVPTHVQS